MTTETKIYKGLEGITAAATQIAEVDGANGKLTLRGYDVGELSGKVTFEEVAYLLWNGHLPNAAEYEALKSEMSAARAACVMACRCASTSTTRPIEIRRE